MRKRSDTSRPRDILQDSSSHFPEGPSKRQLTSVQPSDSSVTRSEARRKGKSEHLPEGPGGTSHGPCRQLLQMRSVSSCGSRPSGPGRMAGVRTQHPASAAISEANFSRHFAKSEVGNIFKEFKAGGPSPDSQPCPVHSPAELMMCLRTCRVPTRVLSLLVSSLGSRKASRRSGEQHAAGEHTDSKDLPLLFAAYTSQRASRGTLGLRSLQPHTGPGRGGPTLRLPPCPCPGQAPLTQHCEAAQHLLLVARH